jgi:alcohol dehydrogenase
VATEAWEHLNPTHVIFGRGTLDRLEEVAHGSALLVTTAGGTRRGLTDRIRRLAAIAHVDDSVEPNPSVGAVEEMIGRWRGERIDAVIGAGGGSAVDTAKVLATALAGSATTLRDLIDRPDDYRAIEPIPVIAIPTTAGTGAEVTPTATIWDTEGRRKLSASTPRMFPAVAIVDPDLADSLPWGETLSSGLDALSQCFEAICNRAATPLTDAVAQRGILLSMPALRALRAPNLSSDPRTAMSEAALLSGLAISQTRTGLAHSISYPITAHFGVPHGLACAVSLPGVLAYNAEDDDGRLRRIAELLGVDDVPAVAEAVIDLYRELGVPEALRFLLPNLDALRAHREEMFTPARADTNIRPVDASVIDRVLDSADSWLT